MVWRLLEIRKLSDVVSRSLVIVIVIVRDGWQDSSWLEILARLEREVQVFENDERGC